MANLNRMVPYLVGAAAIAAVLAVLGVPLGAVVPFALVLACPLMMILMMGGMHGMHGTHGKGEDHTGHGCEHDPSHRAEPPSSTVR